MWSTVVKHFALLAVSAVIGLSGCTVALDYGLEGHVCGPNGECQSGFGCSAANICVTETEATCKPGCGEFEECVRQRCVPSCKNKACPSGTECQEGSCQVVPPASGQPLDEQLGTTCTDDSDCNGTSPGSRKLFCLIPFGGHTNGVCSAECTSEAECGSYAPTCKAFRSEKGDNSLKLCVADAFVPCIADSECSASGLVCGVYETGSTPGVSNVRAASACRAPIGVSRGAVGVGAVCQADANPCIDGLCIATSNAGVSKCTKQCSLPADCAGVFGTNVPSTCAPVTVGGRILDFNYPYVRTLMCVPDSVSIGFGCDPTMTDRCKADAPACVARPNNGQYFCAPHCTSAKGSDNAKCPAGFECLQTDVVNSYCFKTEQ